MDRSSLFDSMFILEAILRASVLFYFFCVFSRARGVLLIVLRLVAMGQLLFILKAARCYKNFLPE
jgi:hypothetical protein